jgi:hypothetical protein
MKSSFHTEAVLTVCHSFQGSRGAGLDVNALSLDKEIYSGKRDITVIKQSKSSSLGVAKNLDMEDSV